MVLKNLKTNNLQVSYEFLSLDTGKLLKKKQSFSILPIDASNDDLFDLGTSIGNCLRSFPKAIDQNIIYNLVEG